MRLKLLSPEEMSAYQKATYDEAIAGAKADSIFDMAAGGDSGKARCQRTKTRHAQTRRQTGRPGQFVLAPFFSPDHDPIRLIRNMIGRLPSYR